MQKKILLVGESWTSTSTHVKGFDQFATATWHTGATDFLAALADSHYAITYMPAHAAATDFPLTQEALRQWDAIILSDIGANTLLLHPDTWLKSRRTANRLTLIHDYVAAGGALMMIGGYYSFQGINGGARYRHTAVEKVLPVRCLAWDDRIETPEGCYAEVIEAHALCNDIPGEWPWLLGYNEVEMAVLRSIRHIIACGREAGIMVGMCGEAASDPMMIPLLLAFGLNEFSMSASAILRARKMVIESSVEELQAVADKAMSFATTAEVEDYMRKFVEKITGE